MTAEIQTKIINRADLSDELIQQLVNLINTAYSRHHWLFPVPRTSPEDFLDETANAEIVLLYSKISNEIVATAFFQPDSKLENALYIGMVAVNPTQQGKGLAAYLLSFLEQLALERGFHYLTLHAVTELGNTEYYKRYDFRVVIEETQPAGTWSASQIYTDVTMVKEVKEIKKIKQQQAKD